MATCVYFAYGSNLHPVRLGKRCPSARLLGVGVLPGWRLAFHKRGRDGSAKGDAVRTGRPEDRLGVAAYELSAEDKIELDALEGLGSGYRQETVRAVVDGVEREGSLYVAERSAVDDTLQPFAWYRAMVAAGAAYHGFPEEFLAEVQAVRAAPDLNPGRAVQQWQLVAEMATGHRDQQRASGAGR